MIRIPKQLTHKKALQKAKELKDLRDNADRATGKWYEAKLNLQASCPHEQTTPNPFDKKHSICKVCEKDLSLERVTRVNYKVIPF